MRVMCVAMTTLSAVTPAAAAAVVVVVWPAPVNVGTRSTRLPTPSAVSYVLSYHNTSP